jgi:hypothetical protein
MKKDQNRMINDKKNKTKCESKQATGEKEGIFE